MKNWKTVSTKEPRVQNPPEVVVSKEIKRKKNIRLSSSIYQTSVSKARISFSHCVLNVFKTVIVSPIWKKEKRPTASVHRTIRPTV